jgi:hypothetical protein
MVNLTYESTLAYEAAKKAQSKARRQKIVGLLDRVFYQPIKEKLEKRREDKIKGRPGIISSIINSIGQLPYEQISQFLDERTSVPDYRDRVKQEAYDYGSATANVWASESVERDDGEIETRFYEKEERFTREDIDNGNIDAVMNRSRGVEGQQQRLEKKSQKLAVKRAERLQEKAVEMKDVMAMYIMMQQQAQARQAGTAETQESESYTEASSASYSVVDGDEDVFDKTTPD